ncbi:hypothetical protein EMCRGX_G034137 [Ephydatia muelleri]
MDFGGLQMAEDFKGEEAQNISAGREVLAELVAEKESLDQSYVHCVRLLDQEISRLQNGATNDQDPNKKQTEKIFIPLEDQKKVQFCDICDKRYHLVAV